MKFLIAISAMLIAVQSQANPAVTAARASIKKAVGRSSKAPAPKMAAQAIEQQIVIDMLTAAGATLDKLGENSEAAKATGKAANGILNLGGKTTDEEADKAAKKLGVTRGEIINASVVAFYMASASEAVATDTNIMRLNKAFAVAAATNISSPGEAMYVAVQKVLKKGNSPEDKAAIKKYIDALLDNCPPAKS